MSEITDIFLEIPVEQDNKLIDLSKTFEDIKNNSNDDILVIYKTFFQAQELSETSEILKKETFRNTYFLAISALDYYITDTIICGLYHIAKGNRPGGENYNKLKISISILETIEQNFNNDEMKSILFELLQDGIKDEIYKKTYQEWDNISNGLKYILSNDAFKNLKKDLKELNGEEENFIEKLKKYAMKRHQIVHAFDRKICIDCSERNEIDLLTIEDDISEMLDFIKSFIDTIYNHIKDYFS